MTNDTPTYNLAAIRDLLLAAFTAGDLRRLFLYTGDAALRPAGDRFGPNDGAEAMAEKAITYCEKRALLPNLLAEVERANPAQYARFADRLRPPSPGPDTAEAAARRPYLGALRERYNGVEAHAFTALAQATRAGGLLVLWGGPSFPLTERPPAHRLSAASQRAPAAGASSPHAELVERLPGLPPLPILSLDAGERLERAFAAASVPLQVVCDRTDVPAAGRHSLLKLAGDLPTRTGLVLSRAEIRDLRADPEKRHILDEARRIVEDGAVLLLACDPSSDDFGAWWAALAPTFRGAAFFAVGEPSAPWPAGVACLGPEFEAISAGLRAA